MGGAVGGADSGFQGRCRGTYGALGLMEDVSDAVGDQIARRAVRWCRAESGGAMWRAVGRELVSLGESRYLVADRVMDVVHETECSGHALALALELGDSRANGADDQNRQPAAD